MRYLAGAPIEDHVSITNPILKDDLQDILLNHTAGAYFQKIIPSFIGLAFAIGVLIFVFMLIAGAIQWIASGGDKAALEGARGRITNAIVGIVILFSVFAIIKIIEKFFGIDILTIDFGSLVI
jgi:hypothetical protein